jgi:Mn2+/Fe2+ NRAMP family transporter
MAEKRLPGRKRRKRYRRRMDVIERFRLGGEIVRMDGNEFRGAAITVKRSKAVYFFANIGLNFTPLDPIKALYWSAVINGVLAPPVMVLMMLLVRRKKVMGELKIQGWLYWLGWLATATMALSIVGMAFSLVSG